MPTFVPLTRGLIALVDDADAERVLAKKWTAVVNPRRPSYAAHYWRDGRKVHSTYLHRFVLGAPAGLQVDHVSGDGLDCRRPNLRLCTPGENVRNRRGWSGRPKGVSLEGAKFRARIMFEGRTVDLGLHLTAEAAAHAYDAAATRLHGEFAWLNFPPNPRRRGVPAWPAAARAEPFAELISIHWTPAMRATMRDGRSQEPPVPWHPLADRIGVNVKTLRARAVMEGVA